MSYVIAAWASAAALLSAYALRTLRRERSLRRLLDRHVVDRPVLDRPVLDSQGRLRP